MAKTGGCLYHVLSHVPCGVPPPFEFSLEILAGRIYTVVSSLITLISRIIIFFISEEAVC